MADKTSIPATASGRSAASGGAKWCVLVVLALAQLMVVLDATIVNIALPAAQRDLGFSDDARQWVVTAYSLTFGGLLLLGGRINDLFGRRRSFVVGLVGFAAASAVGGYSSSFEVLVAARAVQGAFGALLAPAALSLLTVTFSGDRDRGKAFGIYGAISGAGGAVGLLLGGVLTEYLSWNWTLYVNVVIAVPALVGALVFIADTRSERRARLDLPGTAFVTGGLFALVFGLANSETSGWLDPVTLGSLAMGLVLLSIFVLVENMVRQPLVPMRVVVDRVRGTSYLVMLISAVGMFGVFLFLTYYLQSTLNYSPVMTGLAFLPMIVALGATSTLVSEVAKHISPKAVVGIGMAVAGTGLVLLTRVEVTSSYITAILPGLLAVGAGLGAVFAAAMNFATTGVRADDAGIASAMVNTAQQIGGSIGISLLSSVAAAAATDYATHNDAAAGHPSQATQTAVAQGAQMASYHTAFWWAAGAFYLGAVCAALLYPVKAPETHRNAASTS